MTPQSQVDICNLALMRLGMRKIQSITDQNSESAICCSVAWIQSLAAVSRVAPWNCLKKRAMLGQFAPGQTPQPSCPNNDIPSTATQWAPGGQYAVNAYVTFAVPAYLYQCLIANTASASFTADLTKGYWFQTTIFAPNYLGTPNGRPLYEWEFGYQLPSDFLRLIELNGNDCWNYYGSRNGSQFEIYGTAVYTNAPQADAKYIRLETDTTKFDSLFIDALVLNLAANIATELHKDNAELSQKLKAELNQVLFQARQINGAENQPRRYNIASQSRFVASRYRSTNG